jgi:DNA-binding NarL/FixJ family response regulator
MLLVDDQQLRREAVAQLLKPWAENAGIHRLEELPLVASPASMPEQWALMCISVGAQPITDEELQGEIRRWRSLSEKTPLVLLSDLADSDNITAAFQIGANGFLPTNTPPDIAFKALTFILSGGDFFPPSALQPPRRRSGPTASTSN